jgi:hypothetical protein
MKKLYIRTQDRTALIECNEIHFTKTNQQNKKAKFNLVANFNCVGEYASKERCLEIIDDIENRLAQDVDFVLYTLPLN